MTASDITSFAAAHGLQIHPRIIKGYGTIDAFVTETGGMCPSSPGRSCPCDDSLASLSSPDPMNQHCDGYLFVTPAYINEVDPKGKLYGDVSSPAPASEPVPDEVSAVINGYLPNIDSAISLFKKEKYEEAVDQLLELADETDCDVCKEQFMVEALHANNARNLCSLPYEGGCKEEVVRVGARLSKMRDFFAKAAGGNDGSPAKKTSSGSSPYRDAVSGWLNSEELKPYKQQAKFFMASQLASGKVGSLDEAIESAASAHPEWFGD